MNCTEREFCSSTGVISKTPVVLTPEQELFRVPVTECRNPEKGFTGVCCRDPDYVDPWPVGMLGLYNPEILPFDDGSYKPNGNNGNGNQNGNSISQTQQTQRNEAILASPSRVTAAQNYGPNQITSASQNQYTKTQYDRGVTAAASSTSTTAVQRQQTQQTQTTSAGSTGTKRFTAGGLQFVHSGNTRFKPFQKQGGSQCAPRNYVSLCDIDVASRFQVLLIHEASWWGKMCTGMGCPTNDLYFRTLNHEVPDHGIPVSESSPGKPW